MRVSEDILYLLGETLSNSIRDRKERVGLLVYDTRHDTVKGVVLAEFLQEMGFSNGSDECGLDAKLTEDLRRFNLGQLDMVIIGNVTINGKDSLGKDRGLKIIPYHTHPLEDYGIYPSKEDVLWIRKIAAPAVVVGSKKARDEYRMRPPFVAAYDTQGELLNPNYSNRLGVNGGLRLYELELALGEHTTKSPMKVIQPILTNQN